MSLIHVTSKNFEKALQAAPGVAVVDFFATWCGPCKMLAPVIEEAAEDMPEIQFYKVDVDEILEMQEKTYRHKNRYVFSCISFRSFLSWKKRLLP